jgi:hypothetical protein
MGDFLYMLTIENEWDLIFYHTATPFDSAPAYPLGLDIMTSDG